MFLTDGTWQFEIQKVEVAIVLPASELGWYERDMLNAFNRYAYYRYKQIRDCVNTRKCKHMTIAKVRDQLQDDSKLAFTCQLLQISKEEVFYMVDFASKHLQYVK